MTTNKLVVYSFFQISDTPDLFPKIRDSTNKIMKTTNRILAIPAAPAAMPPKPKTAAIMAITRKVTVQRNIMVKFNLVIMF